MKTILYATDYSKNSAAALRYAYEMSKELEARMLIVHVFAFPIVVGLDGLELPFPHAEKDAIEMHRSRLEEFCKSYLGDDCDSTNIAYEIISDNSVIHGIVSVAAEFRAQFIVTGMKGSGKISSIILGNTTAQLFEKAPCPVMAIPEDATYRPIRTIVYATAFEEEDVYAIKKMIEITKPFNAKNKIVHISPEKEYAGQQQMDWFIEMLNEKVDDKELEFEVLWSEDIFDSLMVYVGSVGADLVGMLEREKKGFVNKWFHKDLVKKMKSYGQVPLISFNETNYHTLHF